MRARSIIAVAAGVVILALGLVLAFDADESGGPLERVRARGSEGDRGTRAHGREVEPRESDEADRAHNVGGSLLDPETGPLAEGRVDLWCDDGQLSSRAPVDEEGNFVGPACSSGRTCARLVHGTFEQPEAWVLDPGVMRQLSVVGAPRIVGIVESTAGEPIPDAKILLRQAKLRATARTDTDGGFAVALPRTRPCDPCDVEGGERCRPSDEEPTRGAANLLVWAAGFAPLELEVMFERDEESLEVVLPPPAPPITGRVVGPDGAPMGLRTVVLATHREREAEQHAAEVAEDGSFSFADLAQAEYSIRAIRDGHELAMLDSAVPGERVELRVAQTLQFRDLTVEVRDDADRPSPAVRVDGGPFRGLETDAQGRVEAREVVPGSYTLSVRITGCPVVRTKVDVEPGLEPVHQLIHLPASCVISGTD